MSAPTRPRAASRLDGIGVSIFAEMTELAVRHGAVNLGQGFPDFDGPDFVKEAAVEAIRAGHNQYCRSSGLPEMVRAVAEHQRRFHGLDYDPETEVTIHAGATEAIFATLQALVDPGDEVVLFEPFYDSYPAGVAMAGARRRVVTLEPPDFALEPSVLASAVTPRTRAILVNTPMNPVGKVFSPDELGVVAELARRHDLLVVADEVYEHILFDGAHVSVASLPGLRERTVVISSTGKTFSLTGWKIGWTCAPAGLVRALRAAHQFVTFCNATPFQHALARALGSADAYFAALRNDYRARRDRLCAGLAEAGFSVQPPAGTYFALADIRPLGREDGLAFCRRLPEAVGVAAIPVSAFADDEAAFRHLVRFAFCKTDATLAEGLARLKRLRA